jgi:hypothetical protein
VFYLTFQWTSPVQSVRRNPIKDVQCAQNKTKEVKHFGSVKSVKCPFIFRNVSRNTTQKHHFRWALTFNTLFWKLKKKNFGNLFLINVFVWTYIFMQWTDLVGHLNLSAVFTHRVFKSELIGLMLLFILRIISNTLCAQNPEFLNFKAGSTAMNVLNCVLIVKQEPFFKYHTHR